MRVSELLVETATRLGDTFSELREDVPLSCAGKQVQWSMWLTADTVELRFRTSKGDKFRKGARATRSPLLTLHPTTKGDFGQQFGAVELMIEQIFNAPTLPRHALLVAYKSSHGKWRWRTQGQATKVLREGVALMGVQTQDSELQSRSVGGATHLQAGRAFDLR